jgi:predicted nucleotidyltransferase
VVEVFLERVIRWATDRDDVRAVVLVGSHARGTARPDSDVDLMLLVQHPQLLIEDTTWLSGFGRVARVAAEDWGRVTSLRVWYARGPEVEFGLATVDWATRPDDGTRRVLSDGVRVLLDRDAVFARCGPGSG